MSAYREQTPDIAGISIYNDVGKPRHITHIRLELGRPLLIHTNLERKCWPSGSLGPQRQRGHVPAPRGHMSATRQLLPHITRQLGGQGHGWLTGTAINIPTHTLPAT